MNKRIDEGGLRWFGHLERMENGRIAKRVYIGECTGSHSVGRPQKRWIDTMKDSFKKKVWMSGKQGKWMGHSQGDESLTLMRCHSCGLPHLNEALGERSLWLSLQFKGHKGENFFLKVLL